MAKITVVTICYQSSDFVKTQCESLYHQSSDDFEYIVLDNGSKIKHIKNLLKLKSKYKFTLILENKKYENGSFAHGFGLDSAIKQIKTRYFLLLDSDVAILIKKWDIKLISLFKENVAAIGVKTTNRETLPQNRLLLIDKLKYDEFKISNMPQFNKREPLNSENDTSSDIKRLNKKYDFILLDYINTRYKKGKHFNDLIGVEEYYLDGQLLATHFGRGSSLGAAKYKIKAPRFVKKIYGYLDKRRWMSIVQKLIKN